jgi:predicted TIM-barrel enzyme/AraC-like DNA-binding protein
MRAIIRNTLIKKIKNFGHIIGVAVGSGLMAKCAINGGADLILLLTSSIFREMGRSSMAGYFPFGNSNAMVMKFGLEEILPRIEEKPVIFGICASDPTIRLGSYIDEIKFRGFGGINNYPSVGLIDGNFRRMIENAGLGYRKEVEAIRIAHEKNLFTVAFVFDREQAKMMIDAGADVICVQLGLTRGGEYGGRETLPLEQGIEISNEIFDVCVPEVIKMVYGGPVATPMDLQYVYHQTCAQGYIGGSSFGRIPQEKFITNRTVEFKEVGKLSEIDLENQINQPHNYIDEAQEYIAVNYTKDFSLTNLADELHLSKSYLSSLFNKEIGCAFPEYLCRYRIGKATEAMKQNPTLSISEISLLVGFSNSSYFSKKFKKVTGVTPKKYRELLK